ncbi:MAG: MarR family transcriptional regulator [Hydrotalea flava]|uniref:MarR family winged helix-turn-helix transcriptional regulator n=1 Tax=Hydrotalea lipotrueae TaxID=2803817 RepID=UPI0016AB7CE4|nr:MarR family transcriptional regulator [Hydrotalea lipotrueae]MBY0348863.1 MarR family transcriptional regulator [Hydrotalea flava]NIM36207.1 MarR family transcriptional regulator [Hydrotalea flava]NIM39058.1 MarR family transcriptional regulator [Hydrotalea flava]NIN04293.1 MarR family transcriptional regulator [Hydrotalea flava]NIN15919.1 MarR family transcriptional regulator [Hydrotalea flava]
MKLEQAIQSNKFKDEVHKSALNILYTAWWLKTQSAIILKQFGITHEQFNVLRILKGKHPDDMCVRDIAGRMIEKNSNVPRIIDRLELKKLVERKQSQIDKRETVIHLTPLGVNLLEKCSEAIDTHRATEFAINNEEARQLNALLEKIRSKEV